MGLALLLEDLLILKFCPLEESASHHLGHGVNTGGIYVENHYNECREFFIWIRFDHRRISEKG